ncbi:hypothetical protein R6Q57_006869 [Mikania cordata]
MFRYRAHKAAVRLEEDVELPPDIEFSLGGQHFEMSIERFAVHLGIYYEPETERGTLWSGAFITHIARTRGMVDMLDDLAAIEPPKQVLGPNNPRAAIIDLYQPPEHLKPDVGEFRIEEPSHRLRGNSH